MGLNAPLRARQPSGRGKGEAVGVKRPPVRVKPRLPGGKLRGSPDRQAWVDGKVGGVPDISGSVCESVGGVSEWSFGGHGRSEAGWWGAGAQSAVNAPERAVRSSISILPRSVSSSRYQSGRTRSAVSMLDRSMTHSRRPRSIRSTARQPVRSSMPPKGAANSTKKAPSGATAVAENCDGTSPSTAGPRRPEMPGATASSPSSVKAA